MSTSVDWQNVQEVPAKPTAVSARYRQPWIHSAGLDLTFILAPAFVVTAIVLIFRDWLTAGTDVPLWFWVSMILFVDVAHVYATLFRTYLNPVEYGQQKALLIAIPALCWISGVGLYSIDAMLFWRVLAYLAVFHFVRQQYGFMAIYSRNDSPGFHKFRWLDGTVIYLAMLFPLAYWHTHARNFNWFVPDDFIHLSLPGLDQFVLALFAISAICYVFKEAVLSMREKAFNLPRNLIILGTAFSWVVGIVVLNGDMAFTATNVISHGIPYMALIWIFGRRMADQKPNVPLVKPLFPKLDYKRMFSVALIPAFILFLCALAYIEEGLWDGLVWREHLSFFAVFKDLPVIASPVILAWLIPLLALPQSTHYVLDGFIWRVRHKQSAASGVWAKTLPTQS